MTNGRKLITILAGLAAICLIGFGVYFGVRSYNHSVYSEKLNSGNRYYNEGDYANAVLAYQQAIQVMSDGTEAYAGLARSYTAQGFENLAADALQSGVDATGNSQLRTMLISIQDSSISKAGGNETYVNESLINMIATHSYEDYEQIYSVESVTPSGNSVVVRLTGLDAEFVYMNSSLQPHAVSGGNVNLRAVPAEIHLDDVGQLFGCALPISYSAFEDAGFEGLRLLPDADHEHVIMFLSEGCEVSVESDADGTVNAGAWNRIVPLNALANAGEGSDESEEEPAGIPCSGKVIDAVTGDPVINVHMKFYQAGNEAEVIEAVTDAAGKYEVDLPGGQYNVVLSHDEHIEEEQELYIGAYAEEAFQDFTLSPELATGEIRIVLSWGSAPRDLDSYLFGEADNGADMFVNYRHMDCTGPQGIMANLDLDDTDGYGPETTTVYDTNGVYHFRIHDYTMTGLIGQSGATVTVYLPGSSPQVFSLSDGILHENDWDVFTLDHGTIKPAEDTMGWI